MLLTCDKSLQTFLRERSKLCLKKITKAGNGYDDKVKVPYPRRGVGGVYITLSMAVELVGG